jgi:hypothetical protein
VSYSRNVIRIAGAEESFQLGVLFFCVFCSLLFSCPYFITSFDLRSKSMASAQLLPPPDISQWEAESPRAPDLPEGHAER